VKVKSRDHVELDFTLENQSTCVCVCAVPRAPPVRTYPSTILAGPTSGIVVVSRRLLEPRGTSVTLNLWQCYLPFQKVYRTKYASGRRGDMWTPTESSAPNLRRLTIQQDDGVPPLCINSISPLSTPFSLFTINHTNVILRTSIPAPRSRIRCKDIMRPITRYPTSHFRVKGWFSFTMGSWEGERMGC
jgi:hypothetical protein